VTTPKRDCESVGFTHAGSRYRDGYIPPCIPTRAVKPPAGPGWVHEIKYDGYGVIGDKVRPFTRRGYVAHRPKSA
jgi:ATP-dependent DNA ligase